MSKVLVIDDDLVMLNAINHILSKNGYEVDTATNGKEGLEKIELEEFDLVITDIMMPHHNGLAVLSMVKNNPFRKQTKVVAMSSAGNLEIKNEAIILGAEEFMTKPIKANYLLEIVKKYTTMQPEHRYLVTRKPTLKAQNG
ncbi:MAG: response regulator [Taibaiella sp.]|nr:response regulator [Taibaiella sp.]